MGWTGWTGWILLRNLVQLEHLAVLIMCSITTILSIIEIVLKLVSPVSLWTHYHKRRQTLWWMKIVRRVALGGDQEGLGADAHGDQKSS